MSQIGIYFQSWSSPWTSTASTMDLSLLPTTFPGITIVNIAFAQPNLNYVKGQNTFTGTGVQFSQDFSVVVAAIKLLTQKGIKVMLSVGGGSYWSTPQTLNAAGCVALMQDLGCSGIDIDWEVGVSDCASLTNAIKALSAAGCSIISFAGWSTGAYGATTDTYQGMAIPAMEAVGGLVSWINIMSYDAGTTYDPLGAFTCYRDYYKGPLLLGIEPGPMAWGTKLIQLSDVDGMCNWVMKDGPHNGVFIWSNDKVTTGSPTVAAITVEIVKVFGAISPVPVTVQVPLDGSVTPTPHTTPTIPCPNCGKSLEIILA